MVKIGFIQLLDVLIEKSKTDSSFTADVNRLKALSQVARYNLNKRIEMEQLQTRDEALKWYLRLVD